MQIKFPIRATITALIYNVISLLILFNPAIIVGFPPLSSLFTKPHPGFHITISFPDIPTTLSNIGLETRYLVHPYYIILAFILNLLLVVIRSYMTPLILSYIFRDSFAEKFEFLDETAYQDASKRFILFLKYELLMYAISFSLLLLLLTNPILGTIAIIIILILMFLWIFAPFVLFTEEVGVLEALSNSVSLVRANFSTFLELLVISSVAITISKTIISILPMSIAFLYGLFIWVPLGTYIVAIIGAKYIQITSQY